MPGVGPARRAYHLHQYIESNYNKGEQKTIYELRNLAWSEEKFAHKGDLPMYFTSMAIALILLRVFSALLNPIPDLWFFILILPIMIIALAVGWFVGEKIVPRIYAKQHEAAVVNLREKMKDDNLRKWLKELKKFDQQSYSTIKELTQ